MANGKRFEGEGFESLREAAGKISAGKTDVNDAASGGISVKLAIEAHRGPNEMVDFDASKIYKRAIDAGKKQAKRLGINLSFGTILGDSLWNKDLAGDKKRNKIDVPGIFGYIVFFKANIGPDQSDVLRTLTENRKFASKPIGKRELGERPIDNHEPSSRDLVLYYLGPDKKSKTALKYDIDNIHTISADWKDSVGLANDFIKLAKELGIKLSREDKQYLNDEDFADGNIDQAVDDIIGMVEDAGWYAYADPEWEGSDEGGLIISKTPIDSKDLRRVSNLIWGN